VDGTRDSGNKLHQDLPNSLTGEHWAHVGCDFGPFRFEIGIDETQEKLSVTFSIPWARHDDEGRSDGGSRIEMG